MNITSNNTAVKNRSITIAWGPGAVNTGQSLFDEAEVREVVAQIDQVGGQHKAWDNLDTFDSRWGQDLDLERGRVLRVSKPLVDPSILGGEASLVLSLRYDLQAPRNLQEMDVASKAGNYTKKVEWNAGMLVSSYQEKVLADGSVEVITVKVDSERGLLTYITETKQP